MKISTLITKLKGRKAGIKVTVQNDIITEQMMIAELQAKLVAMWEAVVSSGGATEEDVATMDLLTIELERRTKRVKDLLNQLEQLEKKEGKITPDTVFKGVISILGVLLVIFAEETKMLSNKALGFVIKPRI